LFACLLFNLTGIQGVDDSLAAKPEKRLREVKEKIQKEEQIVKRIKKRKETIFGALETMDRRIAKSEKQYNQARDQVRTLTHELKGLKKEILSMDQQIQKQESVNARRMNAYYRLGRAGVLPVLFSDHPLPDKLRHMNAMKRILSSDWERLQSFHDFVKTKEGKEVEMKKRRDEEVEMKATVKLRMEEQKEKRREKDTLLFRLGQDEKIHKQLIQELKDRERALVRLLEREQKKREEAKTQSTVPVSGSLRSRKGGLPWPVDGDLYRGYGPTFDPLHNTTVMNRGIDIRTRAGEPVRCVHGGEVVYADWFQGYGKLIIVHHGGKYYTISAHLNRLTKRVNERVEQGEIIGYAGDTGSMEGCLVHFEILHKGVHYDPLKWIRGGKHASKKRSQKTR